MPTIHIGVARYHDWETVDGVSLPDGVDVAVSASGELVQRVLREQPSVATIGMPEAEIADQIAHAERQGRSIARPQVIANYIENTVMPGHAATEHWLWVPPATDAPSYVKSIPNFRAVARLLVVAVAARTFVHAAAARVFTATLRSRTTTGRS